MPLAEMTIDEWESLCDGCGRCCLHKLENGDTGEIFFTDVACRLLDQRACNCIRYPERAALVPDCVILTPENLAALKWMPSTCAYRRLHEGKDLDWWHPLVSGNPGTVHDAGISVRDKTVREGDAGDLEDHIVEWPQ